MTAQAELESGLEPIAERGALARGFVRYLPLLILAATWEFAARTGIVSQLALPTLSSVIEAWFELLVPSNPSPGLTMSAGGAIAWVGWLLSGDLVTNGLDSLWRLSLGLGMAIVVGTVIGVLMAWYRPLDALLNPIVQVFYPMPKSALIPVTVLWLGFGHWSKIVLIFIGCMLPVTLSAYNGARGTEQFLVWSARSMGASRRSTLFEVVLPSALPDLLNGIRTALALSFILMVSSELIVARSGLGYMIGWLGDGGVYDAMFAVTLSVAALGFAADRGYLMFVKRVLSWRE
ncbi:MAG TPA: ABC transporter permease [Stellaceae bacterium]|nr:ABC transporter permease [Stellaceae bacterium]